MLNKKRIQNKKLLIQYKNVPLEWSKEFVLESISKHFSYTAGLNHPHPLKNPLKLSSKIKKAIIFEHNDIVNINIQVNTLFFQKKLTNKNILTKSFTCLVVFYRPLNLDFRFSQSNQWKNFLLIKNINPDSINKVYKNSEFILKKSNNFLEFNNNLTS